MEQKISTVSSNITYAASAVTVGAGGLSFNEWIMLGGFLLGVATFFVNLYYRHKTFKLLEKKENE